jgi:hypothetical protein
MLTSWRLTANLAGGGLFVYNMALRSINGFDVNQYQQETCDLRQGR